MRTNSPDVVRVLVPWAKHYRAQGKDYAEANDSFVKDSGFRHRSSPTPQQSDALETVYGKRYLVIRRSKSRILYIDRGTHGMPAYYRERESGKFIQRGKKEDAAVERTRKRHIPVSSFVDYPVKPRRPSPSKKESK